MNNNDKISRRGFIKASVAAGGALLASTVIPVNAADMPQGQRAAADDGLLKGVCGCPTPIEGMRDCIMKLKS